MRKIAVVGAGYVGLVTGVCLADIGHQVTCIDVDKTKIVTLHAGQSPIYEPGLQELIGKNVHEGRLTFTTDFKIAISEADAIFIAVGTPQLNDGSVDLRFVEQAAKDVASHIKQDTVVVTKSTVPVGTNHRIKEIICRYLKGNFHIDVVSNPEFLREGSAVYDTFHGDRIVVGADREQAAALLEEIYAPFHIPMYKTDVRSAEMIKYASNAFLATKISFINEIANLCEKLGANVEDVALGVGMDARIGTQFLQAGIGYGGSCFPKDTKALVQMAGGVDHQFNLLESVIEVNNKQQLILVQKAKERLGGLKGKKAAILGLAFKPNTDDIREAASIVVLDRLMEEGAEVVAYDPVASENAKKVLSPHVSYAKHVNEALEDADFCFILTEWSEFKDLPLETYETFMKTALIFDGRNCYALEQVEKFPIEYHSIGRPVVNNQMNKASVRKFQKNNS